MPTLPKFGGTKVRPAPPRAEPMAETDLDEIVWAQEGVGGGYTETSFSDQFDEEDEAPRKLSTPSKMVWSDGKRSSPQHIAGALRTMAMMLSTGSTEMEAVAQTGQEMKKYKIGRRLLHAEINMREEAATFQAALNNIDILPRQAKELINAAGTASAIQKNLRRAAKQITESRAVRKEIQSEFYEPGITLAMAVVALFIVVYYALPIAIDQFATIGSEAPWAIGALVIVSDVVIWVLGIGVVTAFFGVMFWLFIGKRSPKIRAAVNRFILKLPGLGPVMQYSSTARLFDLLSTSLEAGMTEPEALLSAGRGCGNDAFRAHCEAHVKKMLEEDEVMGTVGKTSKGMIPFSAATQLASAGSQPKQIELMKMYVEDYEEEYKRRLDALKKILPPLIQYPVYVLVVAMVVLAVIPLILMTTEMTNIKP